MDGWLYDENGWPSGFGNGAVNALGEKYQQKYLRCEVADCTECRSDNTVAWYTPEGAFIGRELPDGFCGRVMHLFFTVNPYYVDNLDHGVVAEFLRCTHEYYVQHLPADALEALKGVFTDEPQLSRDGFPWSQVLGNAYFEHCGRDLIRDLPGLFIALPGSEAVRVDFWKTVTQLFRDSYICQISNWCKKHNWLLTGHHLGDEEPLDQIPCNGSLMAQYSGYDIPGVDHLCRIKPDPVVMLQVVSAAHQGGKKQILTESFGLAGWNLNFHGMYWIYHQQLACGVNLLCQHLSGYSLRGLRKRDYPGSYFVHQPWWGDYRRVNDHFAFAGAMVGSGKSECRLAVIHPLSAGWCNFTGEMRSEALDFYNCKLREITGELLSSFHEFHYIDEIVYADSGRAGNGLLQIGGCTYSTVIIPPLTNLSQKLLADLQEFSASGGRILVINNDYEPEKLTVDGVDADDKMREFFFSLPRFASAEMVVAELADILPPAIKVLENGTPSASFTGICRKIDAALTGRNGRFYLLTNGDYRQKHRVEIGLEATGVGVEMISFDGKTFSPVTEAAIRDGYWHFEYTFADGEGVMFFVPDSEVSEDPPAWIADPFALPPVKKLAGNFYLPEKVKNLLLLDRCRYRVDGGQWISDDVSVIHGRLLQHGKDAEVEMEFSFDIEPDFDLTGGLELIVETPERFRFALNGTEFTAVDGGMLFDQAFRRVALPGNLQSGRNTLSVTTIFHESAETYDILEKAAKFETEYNRLTFESEIENIFLYGYFRVRHQGEVEVLDRSALRLKGDFSLAPLDDGKIVAEDRCVTDGFPFFAGKLTLAGEFELSKDEAAAVSLLRFKPLGANSYRIWLNGIDAGFLDAGHYAVKTCGMLKEGKNTVVIQLTSSLRNMLGPHHLAEGESYRVTTLSFSKEANAVGWQPPEFAGGYCVVNFGFADAELA